MRRALLPLTAAAIAITGCGPANRSIESAHEPIVSRYNYVLDLSEAGSTLASGEDQRLASWFDSLAVGYGDRVSVDDPSPSRATREMIAVVAARYGLLLGDAAPVTDGEIGAGRVRVVLSRSQATVQGCPDWSRPSNPEFESATMSNYGCGTNSTMAAMIADPLDLVRGRSADDISPLSATRAVKSYREAAPSGSGGTTVTATSSKGGN